MRLWLDLRVNVQCGQDKTTFYDLSTSATKTQLYSTHEKQQLEAIHLDCKHIAVWDEVKISFLTKQGKDVGHLWFHTAFVDLKTLQLVINKEDIDTMLKDVKKNHKKYSSQLRVEMKFQIMQPDTQCGQKTICSSVHVVHTDPRRSIPRASLHT